MHADARLLENDSVIQGDVCIIGAGAAGVSMALDWINTPYRVILLESGGFEYDDKIQSLNAGNTTGQKYYPLKASRLRYFGGTTGHWAGMSSPLDNVDFIKRDWVPESGWPITRKEMDPFYARAHEKLHLGPYNYDLNYWQKELPNMNAFPLDQNVVWSKMWQHSHIQFGKLYKEAIVKARNIHLYTYATAVNISANLNLSSIIEIIIKNYAGKTHTVRAKHFILACGAIENARLLLASNTQAPKGLANDRDLVGRYFMEHLEVASAELWLLKPFPTDLYTWQFGITRASAELAITEKAQTENRILNGTASMASLAVSRLTKSRMEIWQDADPRKSLDDLFADWAEAGKAAEKDNKGNIARAYQCSTRIEQSPNPNSRVTLGNEKDELGMPRAILHWELGELDKRSIRRIYQLIAQQMGIAGIARLKMMDFLVDENDNSFPDTTNGGWHHMGTTRMSNNPQKGVVNSNCQVHGLENLYIAGSACFPTAGAPNPTLTLVSLSLRLSDYVKSKLS